MARGDSILVTLGGVGGGVVLDRSVGPVCYVIMYTCDIQIWESLKLKEPREVLTMIPNDRGVDLSNTEATGGHTLLPRKQFLLFCQK